MLVLTGIEVRDLLDVDGLIDALAGAFADLGTGRATAPPRDAVGVPGAGLLAAMPGQVPGALAAKLVTLFPGANPAHEALIALFPDRGGLRSPARPPRRHRAGRPRRRRGLPVRGPKGLA